MPEPMMFSQAVEGLVRALRPQLSELAKDHIKSLGIDLRKPFEPAYSLEVWLKVVRYGASLVAPGRPEPEQMFELGRRFIDGFEETIVGKALLATTRLLGPKRTLERMTRNFRAGNNYTETRLVERGPADYELWMSSVRAPAFYRGMLLASLSRSGATQLDVTILSHEPTGATFRIVWAR